MSFVSQSCWFVFLLVLQNDLYTSLRKGPALNTLQSSCLCPGMVLATLWPRERPAFIKDCSDQEACRPQTLYSKVRLFIGLWNSVHLSSSQEQE